MLLYRMLSTNIGSFGNGDKAGEEVFRGGGTSLSVLPWIDEMEEIEGGFTKLAFVDGLVKGLTGMKKAQWG
jgi:hypothetical protein